MARYPYREIIELRSTGITCEKVGFLCGCGGPKVNAISTRALELGLGWSVPSQLSDDELEQLVDPLNLIRKQPPDFVRIDEEVKGKLSAEKWQPAYEVYLAHANEADEEPYAEKTFRAKLREWLKSEHPRPKMLVNWVAAEEVQLDWAGRKLAIHGRDGRVTPAFLFVATLPYSNYTFVRASLDMGMQSWLEHNMRMFEFFGGVPLYTAIDNLATGVTFHGKNKEVNRHYQDLADHYNTIVLPARIAQPTDKGAVEGHVRIMANSIIGTLEAMAFTSIDQLNDSIARLVQLYNDRPLSYAAGRSRRQIFLAEEQAELQALPSVPYTPATWKKCSVSYDGVVQVRGNYYGVPERYASERVDVRVTDTQVTVFSRKPKQCIASYERREDGLETFEGLAGVRPDRFMPLDEYAATFGHKKLLLQWDVERNAPLSPHDIVCRSEKKVWWRCPDCGYSWYEAPARRTKRSFDDCLACANVALVPERNSLAALFPGIAAEWSDRNPFGPDHVFPDFKQIFWWEGSCGHEWRASVSARTGSAKGALCPYCSGQKVLPGFNDVATLAPALAKLWHSSKNRHFHTDRLSVTSRHQVYLWTGCLTHIWRQSPSSWLRENGCADVLEPFERLITDAEAKDAQIGRPEYIEPWPSGGQASVKWTYYLRDVGLRCSFLEWCERFDHEDILAEWDSEKNAELGPGDVTRASNRIVWWKSEECGHSWQESVRSRVFREGGCVYCNWGEQLPGFNTTECLDASLLGMWHPTKNGELTPNSVSDRSHKKIWWLCPTCGFEWEESMRNTLESSRKCPKCSHGRQGFVVPKINDLAHKRPDIAAQWHPTFNKGLRLEDVTVWSKKQIWWKGKCGHVWKEDIATRYPRIDDSCPYCANRKLLRGLNDLASAHPELVAEWDGERNGKLTPKDIRFNSSKRVWWHGECGHVWDAQVVARSNGDGCPVCSNYRVVVGDNDLASNHPDIAAQWDKVRNGDKTAQDVPCGSGYRAWWVCEKGHSWRKAVAYRTREDDNGCPYCSNRNVLKGFNDLKTTHPKIARQLHPDKNGGLKATEIMANTCKSLWWRCELGHEWTTQVNYRTQDPKHDPGCPYCNNRKCWPGFNDLQTVNPIIANMWHPRLNHGAKPSEVLPTASKVVWWKGLECGHVFDMPVYQRTAASQTYCPYCAGRRKPERPIDLS
ncbi:MAG: IS21 family transposase [Gordonibacter sp.]|uniref:IS21 family transposase n=1 Tax=Gordonibacter sp. TaxID=1968902 RepID=UPI002FCC6554